jgi:hypothetical protein
MISLFKGTVQREFLTPDSLFKGTVQRVFYTPIFSQMDSSQAPCSVFKDFSNLASNSMIFAIFDWLSAIIYSAESLLPALLNTESCNSLHHRSITIC